MTSLLLWWEKYYILPYMRCLHSWGKLQFRQTKWTLHGNVVRIWKYSSFISLEISTQSTHLSYFRLAILQSATIKKTFLKQHSILNYIILSWMSAAKSFYPCIISTPLALTKNKLCFQKANHGSSIDIIWACCAQLCTQQTVSGKIVIVV